MKTVLNNLIWLALFSIMVSASVYPEFSSLAQAVIWLINAIVLFVAPLGIAAVFVEERKDKLERIAGTKKGLLRRSLGMAKLTLMFCAVAYAGFTVAAVFYMLGVMLVAVSVFMAREKLKEMA